MPVSLTGATRLFPIIGDPIRYAQTPARLTETFQASGVDAACVPLQVGADALDATMRALASTGNVDGVLVTMPHKHAVQGYCRTLSPRAERLGVVSVIRRTRDGWHGDMLDGEAFVRALREHGATIEGARALLVGAGGAGSAIALALLDAGVASLTIHDADAHRARAVAALDASGRARFGAADPAGHDLICHATPSGMDRDDEVPFDVTALRADMVVGDVIAGHGETRLIAAARAAGCRVSDGDAMVEAAQQAMREFFTQR